MDNKEVTRKRIASAASKVLFSKAASKSARSAAGSALSQRKTPIKFTGVSVASAASQVLLGKTSSKSARTSAGSALRQKNGVRVNIQ